MDVRRLLRLCGHVAALSGVLGCSAVQPPIQMPQVSIPAGMRAVSLRAKMASPIKPGSHVDVLTTVNSQAHTILLQDVELAAYTQGSVTLLTSPKDAEKLTVASEKGRLELVVNGVNSGSN